MHHRSNPLRVALTDAPALPSLFLCARCGIGEADWARGGLCRLCDMEDEAERHNAEYEMRTGSWMDEVYELCDYGAGGHPDEAATWGMEQ